jgi:hypothetical protein
MAVTVNAKQQPACELSAGLTGPLYRPLGILGMAECEHCPFALHTLLGMQAGAKHIWVAVWANT